MDPRARNVVSYADISAPSPPSPPPPSKRPRLSSPPPPPPTAPRANGHPSNSYSSSNNHSPSYPLPPKPTPYPPTHPSNSHSNGKKRKPNKKWETSKTLTHDEIWDDSALVKAWDAAMEEYRAMNGVEGAWKEGGGSALWYNTQPEPVEAPEEEEEEEEYNEEELTYDPAPAPASASEPQPAPASAPTTFAPPMSAPTTDLSTPEQALQLAMYSYYWAGYYMGRHDEMVKQGPKAEVQGAPRGELAEEMKAEDVEDAELIVTEMEEIITERMA